MLLVPFVHFHQAFPVGTGIYRVFVPFSTPTTRVPCGYRDIPVMMCDTRDVMQRSLWVQGYTAIKCNAWWRNTAFPVGTGIYRMTERGLIKQMGVPCGYRDIPKSRTEKPP